MFLNHETNFSSPFSLTFSILISSSLISFSLSHSLSLSHFPPSLSLWSKYFADDFFRLGRNSFRFHSREIAIEIGSGRETPTMTVFRIKRWSHQLVVSSSGAEMFWEMFSPSHSLSLHLTHPLSISPSLPLEQRKQLSSRERLRKRERKKTLKERDKKMKSSRKVENSFGRLSYNCMQFLPFVHLSFHTSSFYLILSLIFSLFFKWRKRGREKKDEGKRGSRKRETSLSPTHFLWVTFVTLIQDHLSNL